VSEHRPEDPLAGFRGSAEATVIHEKEISRLEARIACLEHGLRYASQKFDWLASFHLNSAFSKRAAKEIGVELWNLQSGAITMIGTKV
jgi:hypothetical protein